MTSLRSLAGIAFFLLVSLAGCIADDGSVQADEVAETEWQVGFMKFVNPAWAVCVPDAPIPRCALLQIDAVYSTEFTFTNASILALDASVEWPAPGTWGHGSFQDLVVSVSCRKASEGPCGATEEEIQFKGASPLRIHLPDLAVAAGDILYISFKHADPIPVEGFRFEFDLYDEVLFEGSLRLRGVPVGPNPSGG